MFVLTVVLLSMICRFS